jgi:hypothetical protein
MTPAEIVRAHGDGGLDALINPDVAADMAGHCAEAALLAEAIAVAAEVLKHRQAWRTASASERKHLLQQAVRAAGLSALSGAGLSLVVSLALALVPGGQIWLMAATISSATRLLPGAGDKAFDLRAWRSPA